MMDAYYEYIRVIIKGMISSSSMDLYEFELDFNQFVAYLEKFYQISESNFDYHIFYNKEEENSEKHYTHYITLDNGIYVDMKTCSKNHIDIDVIDMTNTVVQSLTAYSSQTNNKKLIKFMNDVNSFVIKNKKEIDNV